MTDLINLRVNSGRKKTLCHGETAASVLEDLLLCGSSYILKQPADDATRRSHILSNVAREEGKKLGRTPDGGKLVFFAV